ncbi:MAG TPA: nitroreductase family deazaflavin-dependent oxidoreductase [Verrucomicrobiae bacterium]|nr:nitroreductase family deazaflavin-dependent oxidoreductase [Verrucomicrobiae bacterium]
MHTAIILIVVIVCFAGAPLLLRFRPRWVAAFNLVVTNRFAGLFAGWMPGFGILTHVGRKSGRRFRNPVNVFPVSDGFLIALTYGPKSQWAQNILAAGHAELKTRGKYYHLSAPVLQHDPSRRNFPFPVRLVLGAIGAQYFLRVHAQPQS